jgi:hypothetical protein
MSGTAPPFGQNQGLQASAGFADIDQDLQNLAAGLSAIAQALMSPARLGPAVFMVGLPTADPHVVGQVWNNAGIMTISAG